MTRKLTAKDIEKIDNFVKTLGYEIPCAQPSQVTADNTARVPGEIKELLLRLLPLSDDNDLLKHLTSLNTSFNQDDIHALLLALNVLSKKMDTNVAGVSAEYTYHFMFKMSESLARSGRTSIDFTARAFTLLSKQNSKVSIPTLHKVCMDLWEFYKANNGKEKFISDDKIQDFFDQKDFFHVLRAQPKPQLLWRCNTDSRISETASKGIAKIDLIHPLRMVRELPPLPSRGKAKACKS